MCERVRAIDSSSLSVYLLHGVLVTSRRRGITVVRMDRMHTRQDGVYKSPLSLSG